MEELLQLYKESLKEAENANCGYSDTITVGLVQGMFIDEIISELILYFKNKHPNIRILFMRYSFGELMSEFLNDKLDLIISFDYHLVNCQVEQVPLVSYYPAWMIPNINPLSEKESISFSDMANQELLVMQNVEWQDGKDNISEFCWKYGGFYPNFVYVKDMDNLLMWLETYDKCAFLNSRIKVSDRVKMFRISELDQESHCLKYAWKKANNKYGLNILLNVLSKLKE